MNNLVGLSLSLCVRDLLDGLVRVEDVNRIISNTRAPTPESLEGVLRRYSHMYWDGRFEEVRSIMAGLTLVQPRVEDPHYLHIATPGKIWINDGDPIVYGDRYQDDPRKSWIVNDPKGMDRP